MKRLNDKGAISGLFITESVTTTMLIVAIVVGVWAFVGRQDYKNNADKKIAAAVAVAKQTIASEKDNEFAAKEKNLVAAYKGSDVFGSVGINYPKNWSLAITETSDGATPINAYFQPNRISIPALSDATGKDSTAFALRLQVVNTAYSVVLAGFAGNVSTGKVKISPFRAALVPTTLGVRLDGEVMPGRQGVMAVFPLRDKTLQVWTETPQYTDDFNINILPSLSFVP